MIVSVSVCIHIKEKADKIQPTERLKTDSKATYGKLTKIIRKTPKKTQT